MDNKPRKRKVIVIGGSPEERIKAISKLQEEGAEVIEEKDIPTLLTNGDPEVSHIISALMIKEYEPIPDNIVLRDAPTKKSKGKISKFKRQPWQ